MGACDHCRHESHRLQFHCGGQRLARHNHYNQDTLWTSLDRPDPQAGVLPDESCAIALDRSEPIPVSFLFWRKNNNRHDASEHLALEFSHGKQGQHNARFDCSARG